MPSTATRDQRMARALEVLEGLSVGDAFGERYFALPHVLETMIERRLLAPAPWGYTDDSEMALGIIEVLSRHGRIVQDDLAETFARRYRANRMRGYGGTAHGILQKISVGLEWREVSAEPFDGQGSMGNGGCAWGRSAHTSQTTKPSSLRTRVPRPRSPTSTPRDRRAP